MFQHRLLTVALLFIVGCTVLPKVEDDNPDYERCQLVTKKRSLEILGGIFAGCEGGSEGLAALCFASALYTTTTAVVSGSIVLVGNTVHWLEKQGKCEEGFIKAKVNDYNKSLLNQNGRVLEIYNEKVETVN